ncbi:MAG: 2-oxoglutarate dehydrogenase E1 component, partial [Alicyclobacillus sp.]|nr:2-oxoglutarate dehydrogenase E1 component [Alicyclobacillus sp.]
PPEQAGAATVQPIVDAADLDTVITRIVNAQRLARNIREFGHLAAKVNPLSEQTQPVAALELSTFGLTEADLAAIPSRWIWRNPPAGVRTALEAIERLRSVYTGTLGFDFAHVHDEVERAWLAEQVELGHIMPDPDPEDQRQLLHRLIQVDAFEKFLHRTFVGQKRFSIEGVDMLVPMLDAIIEQAVSAGTRNVIIGMAHRGRLNVLANVLRKPYATIFSEFHAAPNKDLLPSEGSMGSNSGWTGDVKYHLGARRDVREGDVVEARLVLANNPSHLEFVNPVVEGYARAMQDDRHSAGHPIHRPDAALAIVVHGDAAFPGEGVVAETLNLSRLSGYGVGGTIHVIANNQLGFTAEANEGRSTRYASDLAKGFDIPIVHVSADDPEACLGAVRLAYAYRSRFHKDFLIDLIGYRRWGHNEMDDPVMTQPAMYTRIRNHPTVRALYEKTLTAHGVITAEDVRKMEAAVQQSLQDAYQEMKASTHTIKGPDLPLEMPDLPETGVPLEQLRAINTALVEFPPAFHVYDKLKRVLDRRKAALESPDGLVDWAHAETLAFATILAEGTAVRLTGQDSERGTFSQRHLVLLDEQTGHRYCPLQHLPQARASFAVHNSPLSETAVMGFEYGYDVMARDTLVLWEAQFGDFANVGQVLIDQFIASGRAKWGQTSGLVLLLPHGYEGQGPEHSSVRVERFLQ